MISGVVSKHRKRVAEFTLLTPIKSGLVPGELRTYEERLRAVIKSIEDRDSAGVPTMVQAIPTIHFARLFIIRPEQYLRYADIAGASDLNFAPLPGAGPKSASLADDGRQATSQPLADPQEGAAVRSSLRLQEAGRYSPTTLPQRRLTAYDHDFREVSERGGTAAEPERTTILPSWLVFTSNYDGDLKSYIKTFSTGAAEELDRVWMNCDGFPAGGTADFEAFWDYILRHQIETNYFYAAYPHLTTARIRQFETFYKHFWALVARTRDDAGRSISGVGALLDEFIEFHLAYTKDFPGEGGFFDEEQVDRRAELKK